MPKLYPSREAATEALKLHYKDSSFIPLIGEPLVVRYYDADGKKQAILAIGKATGQTADDKLNREYHIIDTAEINENVSAATFSAATALDLASATTQSVNNYFQILKNMIEAEGIDLDDGSYFDDDDPTKDPSTCGKYKPLENSNYLDDAKNLREADKLLDAAISELSANTIAAINETSNNLSELSAATINLSAGTVAVDAKADELSANTMAADAGLGQAIADTNAMLNGRCDMLQTQIDEEKTYRKSIKLRKLTPTQIQELELGNNVLAAYDLVDHHNYPPTTAETIVKVYKDNINSLDLDYVPDENKIVLSWNDGLEDRSTFIDVSDFVKDSFLTGVEVVVSGGTKYMKFNFKTYDDKPLPIYVPIEDFAVLYDVLPESYNYLTIDNEVYKIGAKVDVEHGLAGYDTMKFISGLTENIISGAGLNLLNPGAYPGHDETHYIKNAGSLDQADVLLDEAIWETSGLVADISNRVDELSAVTELFSAHTVEALSALSSSIDERIESGLTFISGVVENYVEERLSGLNFDEIYEYVDNSVEALSGALLDYVIDSEEVTAAALNDLNGRLGIVETHMSGDYIPLTGYEISTASTPEDLIIDDDDTVNEAFGKVQKQVFDNDDAIDGLDERLTIIEGAVADNSGVTILSAAVVSFSAATFNEFNEVNNKINNLSGNVNTNTTNIAILSGMLESVSAQTSGVLTVNVNGQQQGKYCPSANTTLDLEIIQEVTGADVLLTGYELSSAHTEEELTIYETDNVNEAFGKVQRQIIDNEAVTAGALNDLNDRINAIGSGGSADVANLSGNVMSNFVHSAEYFSENDTHEIRFKNANGVVISTVNADDFIKDGMVETVYVSGQSLVIEFNTASQKETIVLALSDIFNPDNYYTKDEVNALSSATVNMSGAVVNNQTNISTVSGDVISLSASVVANKTNITALSAGTIQLSADTYSAISALTNEMYVNELVIAAAFNDINDRVTELSGRTVDLSNYYTKDEVYNKIEVDAKIASGGTFDPTNYYTKNDCDTKFETITNVEALSSATMTLSSATHNKIIALSAATTALSSNLNTLSSATHNKITSLSGVVSALSEVAITAITVNGGSTKYTGDTNHVANIVVGGVGDGIAGITMNGGQVPVDSNKIADLGTVITAETPVTTVKSGSNNGNVIGTISVDATNKHQLNYTVVSAATAAQLQALSGAVGTLSSDTHNNYYSKTEVNGMVKKEFATASTVANLDFDKFLTIVTLDSDATLSITNNPSWDMENGEVVEAHVMVHNTGVSGITVTLPTIQEDSRVRVTGDNELLVDPECYGEVNAMITKSNNAYVIYLITSF